MTEHSNQWFNRGFDSGTKRLSQQTERKARLIWTQTALEKWSKGIADPAHTISAPNITEVYDGFVRQFRNGTPWMLVDGNDAILASGMATNNSGQVFTKVR